ncbi:MAG: ABC transporter ATP-binding protein, partial [Clostridiales bacterium]|nr:ABC transporter ATP-binding protein [Clostridiales bacterium]
MNNIVEMKKIVKVYPNGVMANESVDFSVTKGEIHALVGENGAGKTTLMKILFGIEEATSGKVFVAGKEVAIHSVNQALKLGLGMVQQHFMLVPSMTVAENILLGVEPMKGLFLDYTQMMDAAKKLCEKYRFDIDVHSRIEDLSVGDKQKVEILKVLYRQAEVIILDEPTAVLTPQETEELFNQLLVLKQAGHTIVFISHKLREIKELCDRVTVMRRGRTVGTFVIDDITIEEISDHMMGQKMRLDLPKTDSSPGEKRLHVQDVSFVNDENKKVLSNLSFNLHAGEILGVVGVEGNGQKELVDIITGSASSYSGQVLLKEVDLSQKNIREIRDLSLAYIPQERMSTGIAAESSITENASSVIYRQKKYQKGPLVQWKKLHGLTRGLIKDYTIKTASEKTAVKMLSGGNIQKVVVARELMNSPEVIVAEQPTRGIDVG